MNEEAVRHIRQILQKMHPDADFSGTGLWERGVLDSLDIVSLIARLNAAFGIRIPAREILPAHFDSAEAMAELVERLAND